jgi:hypothetical protein
MLTVHTWITALFLRTTTLLTRAHRDEAGADEGMNKLLIFGLVALPLLALLIFFGNDIVETVKNAYEEVVGGGGVVTQ